MKLWKFWRLAPRTAKPKPATGSPRVVGVQHHRLCIERLHQSKRGHLYKRRRWERVDD